MTTTNAFFLWVGSKLPDIARISVLSAAEAGFDTVLFADRPQDIAHPKLRIADWREIELPWSPDEVRLKGRSTPYFAGFADLFRYRLLSLHKGWWIDCDTIILKSAYDFAKLLNEKGLVLGYEDDHIVNNAIIGTSMPEVMQPVYEAALLHYPMFDKWGVTGPKLLTQMVSSKEVVAQLQPPASFYPVHHNEIAHIYLPEDSAELQRQEPEWYCLSLWGEVLSRSGLKHLAPPPGSYLADLLSRHPELGPVSGDGGAMASYLAANLDRLADMDSGTVALQTLRRKIAARFSRGAK
jgi:hypothetical protein